MIGRMAMVLYLIRYGEIGLKRGGARRRFEDRLISNIGKWLMKKGVEHEIETERGRIYLYSSQEVDDVLGHTFGIVSYSPTVETKAEMQEIGEAVLELAAKYLAPGDSFAVRARRTGDHPFTSMDIEEEMGAKILEYIPDLQVDLTAPDKTIYAEVRGKRAFVFNRKVAGPGGLPLGTQGKAVVIISTRRDVISLLMVMRRGITPLILVGPGDRLPLEGLEHWSQGCEVEDWIRGREDLDYDEKEGYSIKVYERASALARETGAKALVTGEGIEQLESKDEFSPGSWKLTLPLLTPVASSFPDYFGDDRDE